MPKATNDDLIGFFGRTLLEGSRLGGSVADIGLRVATQATEAIKQTAAGDDQEPATERDPSVIDTEGEAQS